jgi:topoisomerase-4 subunit A
VKLYANLEEGFVGTALKKDQFITDCSDIDDIIVFLRNGQMMVTKVDQKTYVGKDILHVAVWKRGDKRTTYNLIYRDGPKGASYMKRFQVTGVTRDKLYHLTRGTKGSQVLHFSANPNGEAEKVTVFLRALQRIKKLKFEIDFADLAIKGRGAKGNLVTKYPIKKVEVKEEGVSTLGARKIWFDRAVMRLNAEGRGDLLGKFKGDDKILELNSDGSYRLLNADLSIHFDENMTLLRKHDPERPISAIYYDGEKQRHYCKRFIPETLDKKEFFITEHPESKLEFLSADLYPRVELHFRKIKGKQREPEELLLSDFIAVKGEKAQGNQLSRDAIRNIKVLGSDPEPLPPEEENTEADSDPDLDQEGQGQITLELD